MRTKLVGRFQKQIFYPEQKLAYIYKLLSPLNYIKLNRTLRRCIRIES